MKCPKCEAELSMMVEITIQAPSSYYGNLSKTNIRHADVRFLYAHWADMWLTCRECGWFFNKTVDELLKQKAKGGE